jgi:hypothetical protein
MDALYRGHSFHYADPGPARHAFLAASSFSARASFGGAAKQQHSTLKQRSANDAQLPANDEDGGGSASPDRSDS